MRAAEKRPLNHDQQLTNKTINKVLAAAVVNESFCRLLLSDPYTALRTGYHGESFDLSPEEWALILSIRADSLVDFASQLTQEKVLA